MRIIFTAGSALIASLHVLKHLTAARVAHLIGRATEVRGEEGTEGGDASSTGGSAEDLGGIGRSEEVRRVDLEALKIGVHELTAGHGVVSLEGVAGNVGRMSVIWQKIEIARSVKCHSYTIKSDLQAIHLNCLNQVRV